MKISFFNPKKPRKFNYTPRSYNPELEKFEITKKRVSNNGNDSTTERNTRISFKELLTERRKARKKSTLRIAAILSILFFIAWWLYS